MAKIKVGLIGCGKFAVGQHLPNCVAVENVELWHCSSRSEAGRKNAEEFGSKKISSDYRDVLNDPEVDMVIISVPHEWHMFYLSETIKAGKHVLCEKPMTMSMDEAYETIKLVRKNGVKLCVDYNRRFSPAMIDMKQAYQSHRKNPTGKARVYTQENNREIWAEEKRSSILIRINDESLTYGGVHIDWKEGGGLIIGEGCHWLDLMCWLLEDRPVRITGVGSTRLNYILSIEFYNGTLGCLFFSGAGTFEYPKELIEIQDHGKLFRSECFVENHYFGRGERTVKTFPMQYDFYPDAGTEGGMSGYLRKIDAMGKEYVETGSFNYLSADKGHRGLLEAFANAIDKDEPSPLDEMSGMRATYMSQRAMDSIKLGTSLPINIEDWEMYVY